MDFSGVACRGNVPVGARGAAGRQPHHGDHYVQAFPEKARRGAGGGAANADCAATTSADTDCVASAAATTPVADIDADAFPLKSVRYYLSASCALKLIESPCVYDIGRDELYEVDEAAFAWLKRASGEEGAETPAEEDFLQFCLDEGIITPEPVRVTRAEALQSPVPSLRYLELQMTNRCNLRCRHCFVGDPERIDMPLESLKKVLDEFQHMQGLRLLITGGEPTLHNEFARFNDMLPSYRFRKILFTNGQSLDDELLLHLHVDEIQVSIDGLEKGHDALRGKGTYRRALGSAERAMQHGFPVSIATMVHRENLDEFTAMDALFRDMSVTDWTVDIPSSSGFLTENRDLIVSPEEAGRYLAFGFGGGLHGGGPGFACGLHLASVLADGRICKCAFYGDQPVGSVGEGLTLAWGRIRPVPLDELACHDMRCEHLESCRGGCRFRAEMMSEDGGNAAQDRAARDLYKCCAYGII